MKRLPLLLAAWLTLSQVALAALRPEFVLLDNPEATPSFKHHWRLDEATDSTVITDRITGNTGSTVDNTEDDADVLLALWQATGLHAGWDGEVGTVVNEPITLASSPGASCTSGLRTIALFCAAPIPGSDAIVSVSTRAAGGCAFEIGGSNRKLEFRCSQDGTNYNKVWRTTADVYPNMAQSAYNVGLIYMHIAVTIDPDNEEIKLYVNGYESPSTAITNNGTWGIYESAADLLLGNYDGGDANSQCPMIGADVRIYSRVLTAQEILALAKRNVAPIDPTTETYFGVIPPGGDVQPALQHVLDGMGSGINHATLHRVGRIEFPHGSWVLNTAVATPNTSSGGATITGSGRYGGSSTEAYTLLSRGPSWTGDSIGLIEVRGSNWRVENLSLRGTSSAAAEDQAGVGIHLTRGPSETGSAPSNLTVHNVRGFGLQSLVKAGWDKDENNCDFVKIDLCIANDNCSYLFHNANQQGQIQSLSRCIGNPTEAMVFWEHGGPIYMEECGTSGTTTLLKAGSVASSTAHATIERVKLDAQQDDAGLLLFDGPSSSAGLVTIRDVYSTDGTRGILGTNIHARGQWRIGVYDSAGIGAASVEAADNGWRPSLSYFNCQWYYDSGQNESYSVSPAYLISSDPTNLLTGDGPTDGSVRLFDTTQMSRVASGSLPVPPKRIPDYNGGRAINVTIGGGE